MIFSTLLLSAITGAYTAWFFSSEALGEAPTPWFPDHTDAVTSKTASGCWGSTTFPPFAINLCVLKSFFFPVSAFYSCS